MFNLINKETGFTVASTPEKLPPLRAGYVRVVHQTFFYHAESFIENGLIYNREFAQKDGFSYYTDVASMAIAYYEDEFWEMLTRDNIKHRGANAMAIFDMPAEEMGAHQTLRLTPMLNGTISRGYIVGIISNEKLSIQDMEEKKRASISNPLPPFYETPNWKENLDRARQTLVKQDINDVGFSFKKATDKIKNFSVQEYADEETVESNSKNTVFKQKTEKNLKTEKKIFSKMLENIKNKTDDWA